MRKNITAIILFCLGIIFIQTEAIGGVIRCSTVLDCDANQTDYLMMVAHDLYNSSSIDNLASRRASYNGFNISIVDVENMTGGYYLFHWTGIRKFIKEVYETQSAEHTGDGYLGFVLLIGDAYKDDNSTRMLWDFDGYPGDFVEASDHYYACLDGDDYPDVMIGRLSGGNEIYKCIYI
ncbi:MAG: C25 family cysteine peptidase [Methanosarcinaceae archaeon]